MEQAAAGGGRRRQLQTAATGSSPARRASRLKSFFPIPPRTVRPNRPASRLAPLLAAERRAPPRPLPAALLGVIRAMVLRPEALLALGGGRRPGGDCLLGGEER